MIQNHVDGCRNLVRNLGITGISKNTNCQIIRNFRILPFLLCRFHILLITWHIFSLFDKQKSLESHQESWNQAKIPKDSESRQAKSIVPDPLILVCTIMPGFCKSGHIYVHFCLQPATPGLRFIYIATCTHALHSFNKYDWLWQNNPFEHKNWSTVKPSLSKPPISGISVYWTGNLAAVPNQWH